MTIREQFRQTPIKKFKYPMNCISNCVDIPQEWVREQEEYVKNLSGVDKAILLSYTFGGDKIIQGFILNNNNISPDLIQNIFKGFHHYNTKVFPLSVCLYAFVRDKTYAQFSPYVKEDVSAFFNTLKCSEFYATSLDFFKMSNHSLVYCTDELLRILLTEYKNRLSVIIQNAPAPPKMIYLWRGIREDGFMIFQKKIFRNRLFMSSSINAANAINFTKKNQNCCLLRITILPGTSCICNFLLTYYPYEREIMFPTDSLLYANGDSFQPNNSSTKTYPIVIV